MSLIDWWNRAVAPRSRRVGLLAVLALALIVVAGLAGFAAGTARERGRHAATAEVLTGTVILSNEGSRFVIFYPDGIVDPPNDADWFYYVIADGWMDESGTLHSDQTYPTCLAGDADSRVSTEHRRVELATITWDNGGTQPLHVAVRVRCLD